MFLMKVLSHFIFLARGEKGICDSFVWFGSKTKGNWRFIKNSWNWLYHHW